jgi:type I restriction enzyme M protein
MADERAEEGLNDVVADPATGTGGSLLAAHDYMAKQVTSKVEAKHLKNDALRGNDIVDSVVRLCAMNLYLHGIGGTECPIVNQDALAKKVTDKVDMVLANPPFGKKLDHHHQRKNRGSR